MNQAGLKALEQTLTRLPAPLKKYLAGQLVGQINAQANTMLDIARPHLPCPLLWR